MNRKPKKNTINGTMRMKRMPNPFVEIVRSFSYKHNAGNYESRDFFCSQKAECRPEDAEKISSFLYQFCKSEVIKAVNQFIEESKPKSDVLADTNKTKPRNFGEKDEYGNL